MKRRLSVTNLSSENNLPTFRLNAPVNTLMTFTGTSNFNHNSAYNGGAVYTNDNFTLKEINNFFNNSQHNSHISNNGGAVTNISLSFNGTSSFSHNSAHYGGVFYTEQKVVCT